MDNPSSVIDGLSYGLAVALAPGNLLACFFGVLVGTLVGVLPGIGTVGAMALLFPLSYSLHPAGAIILLSGIYYGAMYGGSTTSILMNIPGEAASVVTCLDGYQMARRGRAGAALGIAAFGSFIAGTLGVVGITLLAPPLASFALRFGPPEIFCLLLLGLAMIASIGSGSRLKSLAMALLGLLLACIGTDALQGTRRFTLGSATLSDGLDLSAVLMGLFGVAEVMSQLEQGGQQEVMKTSLRGLLPSRQEWKQSAGPIARGSILGFLAGSLPGVGTILPSFVSYGLERKLSKHPEEFGHGAIAGVAGPESANNAATAGSMIPLLTLGVPPNAVMAVLLGAFLVHGVQPGPTLVKEHADVFWGVIVSMYIGNVMLLLLNLPLIGIWVQLLRVPFAKLAPMILLLCVAGVYSVSSNIWSVAVMLCFGVVGYLMKRWRYDPVPFVMAFVLGRMIEETFRQSLLLSRGSMAIFLQRPIALIALLVALGVFGAGIFIGERKKQVNGGEPGLDQSGLE
jgi:putative tricarboxylic transport membrane protein